MRDLASTFDHLYGKARQGADVDFIEYHFWTPQPITADIYILPWILHDYPDHKARAILKNQIPAMKVGSKLVIMERVLDDGKYHTNFT